MLLPLLLACTPDTEPLVSRPVGTTPFVCEPSDERPGDGIDNDCDGLIDCADDDLTTPFTAAVTADNLHDVCAMGCPRVAPSGVRIENSDLIDLEPLSCLTEVGSLQLEDNPQLASLRGLESLEVVRNSVELIDNGLRDLDGLTNLRTISDLTVHGHPELRDLEGLASLEHALSVELIDNAALRSLEGLERLDLVDGLRIEENGALISLRGLDMLAEAGSVTVAGNASLESLTGLEALTVVGDLGLHGNPALTSLEGLASLQRVDGQLSVHDHDLGGYDEPMTNASLVDLRGLGSLRHIGYLSVGRLQALTGLEGLETLGGLWADTPDISALQGTAIEGDVVVYASDLTGLEGLVHAGILHLKRSAGSLAPLAQLETVEDLEVIDPSPDATGFPSLREAESIYWRNVSSPRLELPALRTVGSFSLHGGSTELVLPDGFHAEELTLSMVDMTSYTAPAGATLDLVDVYRAGRIERLDLSQAELGALSVNGCDQLTDIVMPPTAELSHLFVTEMPLTTLDAFTDLRRIDGDLRLQRNTSLVDITALYGLEYAGDVTITGNAGLGNAAALDLVDAIDEIGGSSSVWGNR